MKKRGGCHDLDNNLIKRALEESEIRKAIAMGPISRWKQENKLTNKEISTWSGAPYTIIGHWFKPKEEKGRFPTAQQIISLAQKAELSLDDLLYEASLDMQGKYSSAVTEILEEIELSHQVDAYLPHDDTDAHHDNLMMFHGAAYDVYFIHMDGEQERLNHFHIKKIGKPKEKWYSILKMNLIRDDDKENIYYTGTLIVPPQLTWAYAFIEWKTTDKIIHDRGVIVLNFPQKALTSSSDEFTPEDKTYDCGTGVMLSVDRNHKHALLLQRVVAIRDGMDAPEEKILELLHEPFDKGYIVRMDDIESQHKDLYYLLKGIPLKNEERDCNMKVRIEGYKPLYHFDGTLASDYELYYIFDNLRYGPIHDEGEMTEEELIKEFQSLYPGFHEDYCHVIEVGQERKVQFKTYQDRFKALITRMRLKPERYNQIYTLTKNDDEKRIWEICQKFWGDDRSGDSNITGTLDHTYASHLLDELDTLLNKGGW